MRAYLSRLALVFAFYFLAVIIALAGLAFVFVALYLRLAEAMPPAHAALATGGIAVVLAVIVAAAVSAATRRPPRRVAADRPAARTTEDLATEAGLAAGELIRRARRRPGVMAASAFAAGFAVGLSPRARRSLLDLLR